MKHRASSFTAQEIVPVIENTYANEGGVESFNEVFYMTYNGKRLPVNFMFKDEKGNLILCEEISWLKSKKVML